MGLLIDMTKLKIDQLVFTEFLPEMFKRVGYSEQDINDLTKEPQWYLKNTWSVKDEEDFTKWLITRLKYRLNMSQKVAEREARMFLFNFGWSTQEEKQGELALED